MAGYPPPYGYGYGYGYASPYYPNTAGPQYAVGPSTQQQQAAYGYASRPYDHLFPQGTDPDIVGIFHVADRDGSGLIDEVELQVALDSRNRLFSMRTIRLLIKLFTVDPSSSKIGPNEFVSLYYSLQNWRKIFEKFDWDRDGWINAYELRSALESLELPVSQAIVDVLLSRFEESQGRRALGYDDFVDCCLVIKGLTEKFKKAAGNSDQVTFTFESFMCAALPYLLV